MFVGPRVGPTFVGLDVENFTFDLAVLAALMLRRQHSLADYEIIPWSVVTLLIWQSLKFCPWSVMTFLSWPRIPDML